MTKREMDDYDEARSRDYQVLQYQVRLVDSQVVAKALPVSYFPTVGPSPK